MTCARLHNLMIEHDTQASNGNNDTDIENIGISTMPGAPINLYYNSTMIALGQILSEKNNFASPLIPLKARRAQHTRKFSLLRRRLLQYSTVLL